MSAIALPLVNTTNATSSSPVNVERLISYNKEDITAGTGINPPDPARYSGYPSYNIVFKVAVDGRTGNTDTIHWKYADAVTRDADFTLLETATTTIL